MNIQMIIKLLTDAGIEDNEAKCEVKMLLEHFCNYTENEKLRGVELTDEQLDLVKSKVEERIKTKKPVQYVLAKLILWVSFSGLLPMY